MKWIKILLMMLLPVAGYGQLLWQKTFKLANPPSTSDAGGYSFVTFPNGEIITSGFAFGGLWIIKFDTTSQVIWSKMINNAWGEKVIKAGSNHLMFAGANYPGIILTKTDTSANVVWSNTYDFDELNTFNDIIQTDGGDFIVIGASSYYDLDSLFAYGYGRPIAFCIDSAGAIKWSKSYYPYVKQIYAYDQNTAVLTSIQRIHSNSYLICGTIADTISNENGMFLFKIDTMGSVLEAHRISTPRNDWANGAIQTSSDKYIIYGFTVDSMPNGFSTYKRPVYMLLDSNYTFIWVKKILNNSTEVVYVTKNSSSEFLLLKTGGWLTKIDNMGNWVYSRGYFLSSSRNIHFVEEFYNSLFMIGQYFSTSRLFMMKASINGDAGCYYNPSISFPIVNDSAFNVLPFQLYEINTAPTVSINAFISQNFLYTTDTWCNTSVSVDLLNDKRNDLLFYPNPLICGEKLYFNNLFIERCEESVLKLYDMEGQLIINKKLNNISKSDFEGISLPINIGVYILKVYCKGTLLLTDKLIII